jgi:hypothetical protein
MLNDRMKRREYKGVNSIGFKVKNTYYKSYNFQEIIWKKYIYQIKGKQPTLVM